MISSPASFLTDLQLGHLAPGLVLEAWLGATNTLHSDRDSHSGRSAARAGLPLPVDEYKELPFSFKNARRHFSPVFFPLSVSPRSLHLSPGFFPSKLDIVLSMRPSR